MSGGEGVGVSVRRINKTEVTMSACFTASADKHQKKYAVQKFADVSPA